MELRVESGDGRPKADDRPMPEEPSVVRLPRRRDGQLPEPELHQTVRGSKPGSRFLRLTRQSEQKLRRVDEGEYEATRAILRPATAAGRVWAGVRRLLVGEALASSQLSHERLTKIKALAIFSTASA